MKVKEDMSLEEALPRVSEVRKPVIYALEAVDVRTFSEELSPRVEAEPSGRWSGYWGSSSGWRGKRAARGP